MKFSFITLFPELISGYFKDSILSRAIEKDLLEIDYVNPRDYSTDKWKKVDDTAVGGGAGMVMTPQPLFDTLNELKKDDVHIVFATPVGKPFNQNDAKRLAKKKHIAFVSGRYEGIDERLIASEVDEEWSIGDYVLSGGELAAMVLIDGVTRLIPGALGHEDSAEQDSFVNGLLDTPHYTRPEVLDGVAVPDVLLSGNHKNIEQWRLKQALGRTWLRRPDMLEKLTLDQAQEDLLAEFIRETEVGNTTSK